MPTALPKRYPPTPHDGKVNDDGSKMNSYVSSVHKGMPSHLRVGLVLASINGEAVLGWPHSKIMQELKKGVFGNPARPALRPPQRAAPRERTSLTSAVHGAGSAGVRPCSIQFVDHTYHAVETPDLDKAAAPLPGPTPHASRPTGRHTMRITVNDPAMTPAAFVFQGLPLLAWTQRPPPKRRSAG